MFEQILTSFTSAELQVPSVLFFDHKIYTSGILIDVVKTPYHIFLFKQKELD